MTESTTSKDPVKRALTQRRTNQDNVIQEANAKLVYTVWFAIAMLLCLTALEIVYIALMGTWNSEIFAGIMGLSGTVLGIFVGQKA